jgi:hypothetical protein
MLSLKEIKVEVERLAATINVQKPHFLPAYDAFGMDAQPYVEIDDRGYHLVVNERGIERERLTTPDLDELLYRIFRSVTFQTAVEYELKHRDETRDCRRLIFDKQIELLSRLSLRWAARETEEHVRILCEHPYDDDSSRRVEFFVRLRDRGFPESFA